MDALAEKLIVGFCALCMAFAMGMGLESSLKKGEIADLKLGYTTALGKSQSALATANAENVGLSRAASDATVSATQAYEKGRQDEKAQAEVVIADLRAGTRRLRVATNRPAGSCPVPGTEAGASAGDGPAQETLAGPVAARLAERYADYNEIVDELTLAQATILADRLACGSH